MKYTYSICHPDKKGFEYPIEYISKEDVYEIASTYPWMDKLDFLESYNDIDVCFSPSLDFKNILTGHIFCLKAHLEKTELKFSLWYNRPTLKKSFFGIGKEVEKFEVFDRRFFNIDEALVLLNVFLNEDYNMLEQFMTRN